ncbi:MAG: asparaginase [Pseudanabaenaceae cyanobacterium]|jgi:L-asparaginase
MNLKRNRQATATITVELLREGIVESVHQCMAVVADNKGRCLSVAGDAHLPTFARSCLKPVQAIAISRTGVREHFRLTEKDLAIIAGSHQGSTAHARQVFNILWQCDVDPSALQCPQVSQTPLRHNCSGKHAGMIAVCQQQGWTTASYMERNHPVQQLILSNLAELLQMPPAELIGVHDDCGVPTYQLELVQLAHLYAQLSSHNKVHVEQVVRAMLNHPEMVAGNGEFDTELMRRTQGQILSKAGAEGVQCIGNIQDGLGLAIKVIDGTKRAKHATAIHLLKQLGWISHDVAESLTEMFLITGKYTRLEVTGELVMH